jgi:hypothetical protein
MRNYIILFAITALFLSCKSDSKTVGQPVVIQEKENNLKVIFRFGTDRAGKFKISLNKVQVDELQFKDIHVYEEVSPTNDDQILAIFGPNEISSNLVFSLGNKVEKTVIIKEITVIYGHEEINISKVEEINEMIVFNKFVQRDSTSNSIKTKRLDNRLNPTFRIRNRLLNRLKKAE